MTERPMRRAHTCDGDPETTCNYAENMSEPTAERAVKKFFATLGVDVSNPESVEEFR